MRNTKGQFQLGHSGGRPKGARNKLAAQVFEDILRHWCEPAAPGSKPTGYCSRPRRIGMTSPKLTIRPFPPIDWARRREYAANVVTGA